MKQFLTAVLFFVVSISIAHAQDSAFARSNRELQQRIYSLPYYSYGKGLGFTSPDSIYQMNIRFRIQSRVSWNHQEGNPSTIDGQIRRLRLRLDGYVGSPRFTYALQLSFAPGDLGGEIHEGENLMVIRDAVMFYSINERLSIGFGQTKLPGNRQRVNSSGALQLTDRSINNAAFNLDRDFGVQINYLYQQKERFSYNLKGAITQGEGRNFTENNDAHLAYTGKVEIYPLGSFIKNGEYFEGDIMREQKPKLMLSGAYQFNHKAKKSQGQLGRELFDKRNLHSFFGDLVFKYQGFAFMAAYMQRYTQYPLTFNPDNLLENDYVLAGKGFDLQTSYLFTNNFELIGRYSWQRLQKEVHLYKPNSQQLTIGLSKYIWEHAFKVQAEASYNIDKYHNGIIRNPWYIRFQIEVGI